MALEHRPAPRTARVRLPEPDNSDLLKKHTLTLIGRMTNPSVQKVGALIPFFIDHWKADIPPVGSDLGSGMFQFQFELESDLVTVLAKQPYHYSRWMIILERWVPTLSPTFPSMIPFWIKIQGIPVHLWSEEAARSIGDDIGTYETSEVTALSFRMRVHVNGRLPLIKTTTIEYPNGEEGSATLVYDKLERHCLKCCRLDHEIRDCLEAKHEKKALLAAAHEELRGKEKAQGKEYEPVRHRCEVDHSRRTYSRHEDLNRAPPRGYQTYRERFRANPENQLEVQQRQREGDRQSWKPKDRFSKDRYRTSEDRFSHRSDFQRREAQGKEHGESHSVSSQKSYSQQFTPNRAKEFAPQNEQTFHRRVISKDHHNSREQGSPSKTREPSIPQEELNSALGEVQEVLAQYSNCADPIESAARKERLRQVEAKGQYEKAAEQIVRASRARKGSQDTLQNRSPVSAERVPIADRLGPLSPVTSQRDCAEVGSGKDKEGTSRLPATSRLGPVREELISATRVDIEAPDKSQKKRKPGRPPGTRKINGSPILLPGANSRKRRVQQTNLSNSRKKLQTDEGRSEKVAKGSRRKEGSSRAGIPHEEGSLNSDNVPICNLIPKSTRRRMDFRVQSNPVP